MDSLEILERHVSSLANHHYKYIYTLRRFLDSLVEELESSGKLMQVHLWHSSNSPAEEMKIIATLTDDLTRNVQHVSCYYALQFLHMNFRHQDILALEISSRESLEDVYHRFMMNIGADFRDLTRAYLNTLLNIYLPNRKREDFFICSVGTRADQDDIDVGIITADNAEAEDLNRALQNITQHMLVYATPLHLYLSEHVGEQPYTTTISEYIELLEPQIQDVVIISELIGARMILGDGSLFEEFQDRVISRYFYNPMRDIRHHEGFLRGILGEARALLVTPLETDTISPKEDALRIIKSIIASKKVIHGLKEVNAWEIISALIDKEPHLGSQYELLFKAISFLELFKFQLQFFVAQEDTFLLAEIDQNQLAMIAYKMGYQPIGTVSAWDQLIIDYYRYVKEVRKLCDLLLEDVSKHLSSVSLFMRMLKIEEPKKRRASTRSSLARDFIHTARFFKGTRYWEDVLDLLESDANIQNTFVEGFEGLEEESKKEVIEEYNDWAQYSPITLMRLITILSRNQENILGEKVAERMSLSFLQRLQDMPYTTERFCKIFSHYPRCIHEFLQYLPESQFEYLHTILERPVVDERLEVLHSQLKDLCEIHEWSGQYFHRFFSRVISNHPEYLSSLSNYYQLHEIAIGLLATADVYPTSEEKKQALGDYYDLEFLRIGIGTMRGADLRITNREFTVFCDNYMQKLFDVCSEEVERESAVTIPSTDTFAIIAAGGHAREQAYDDDYDLIALVDTDDEEVMRHATRIVTRMNREILKRGLLPHYRLGEILGGFVNPLSQVIEYLSSGEEESFIDLSQLLGARMIIGGNVIKRILNEQILDRFVFDHKEDYVTKMIDEIRNRQDIAGYCDSESCNLKESMGGLRDIEAVALILKAYLGIYAPFSQDFFQEIRNQVPGISEELDILSRSMYYLRTIRDLYRITVAAEDNINPDYLVRLGTIFMESNRPEWSDSNLIMEQIHKTLYTSSDAITRIVDFLEGSKAG